jgi:hypothetical protein
MSTLGARILQGVPTRHRKRGVSFINDLVMQDDVEKRAVDVQFTVVLNKAESPELIQKETQARTRRPDHFGERFLTNLRDDGL